MYLIEELYDDDAQLWVAEHLCPGLTFRECAFDDIDDAIGAVGAMRRVASRDVALARYVACARYRITWYTPPQEPGGREQWTVAYSADEVELWAPAPGWCPSNGREERG